MMLAMLPNLGSIYNNQLTMVHVENIQRLIATTTITSYDIWSKKIAGV